MVDRLRALGATVATGRFRTEMLVDIQNDGPVTVLARDSERFRPGPGDSPVETGARDLFHDVERFRDVGRVR